ncbi:MAG: hypothetical protein GXO22_05125, partial [Aquificae bacterium]|nr:hypothetical protein [Aquificota bacterium]
MKLLIKPLILILFAVSHASITTENEFLFIPKEKERIIILTEGLTEDQIHNIKVYTTRALNLILDAYSSLHRRRIILKETYSYIDGAIFFLNEARQHSPSYLVHRQIEALKKRYRFFPDENYTEDLETLRIYIEEISGNLNNYQEVYLLLKKAIKKAKFLDNSELINTLETLEEMIKVPLIDGPI